MTPSPPLPKYSAQLDEFIRKVAQRANYFNDDERALSHLRTVFRVMRNRSSFEQSLRFLEMLPVALKIIFLNDWHIAPRAPVPINSLDELADAVRQHERNHIMRDQAEALRVLRAIFDELASIVSYNSLHEALGFLPVSTRSQLVSSSTATYQYSDTCIWLS
ncbi:MAG: DUF2267 domain-containing protein [Tunicatimonas sp.]